MISKERAQELIEPIKGAGVACLQYLGVETVPYRHIKNPPYRTFPPELINQDVHVFEGLSSTDERVSVALCQYYVTTDGHVYKDTYPSDGNCVKIH